MSKNNIIFANKPKLSEYDAHKTFNERRLKLFPLIEEYLGNSDMFGDADTTVDFYSRGVGSIVAKITTSNNKSFILKVPLSLKYAEGEEDFLKVWGKNGVKVPNIYESGRIGEHRYMLMEYIDSPTIQEQFSEKEMLDKKVFVDLGRILHRMHESRIKGFGRVMDGKPEFQFFEDWIDGGEMSDRVKYLKDNNIFTEELTYFDSLVSVMVQHVKEYGESTYCHTDFGIHNAFATDPYTIFDPNPRFNCAYFDLGKTLLMGITKENSEENEQLLKGYFENGEYDEKALRAFVILNGYYKAPDWHKKNRRDLIQGFEKFLYYKK
jgi:fructosamine-3-kinase